ncbi:unnamed protein product [Adineta ricciae]|uniref:Carrier domain-containing protein n=1 Tax=Adineta ricciae TaxID=249248 RepID=A0A815UW22_ADIRI|nr:unnamed protein product [Adineta ricciae]CAF1631075.1 unnamed protein product [Adineta ricciae]
MAFIFSNNEQLKDQLVASRSAENKNSIVSTPGTVFCQFNEQSTSGLNQNICFVYCGTGPQWWKMGRELYFSEPVFREWIQKISKELQKLANEWLLIDELINTSSENSSKINETNIAQSAIFAVQIALTALWLSWGIYPKIIVGHSVGEVAAAYVGGYLTLSEACKVIYQYSVLQHRNTRQGGRMLAVIGLAVAEARALLQGLEHRISFAAINSPTSVTFSGYEAELEQLYQLLTETRPEIFKTWIRLENALHSPLMDNFNIHEDLLTSLDQISGVHLTNQNEIFDKDCADAKLYSTVTSKCSDLCFSNTYWWENLRSPANFSHTIQTILQDSDCTIQTFLEISPHPVLVNSIQECIDHLRCNRVPSIIWSLKRKESEQQTILSSLCRIQNVNWSKFWHTRTWASVSIDQSIRFYLERIPLYAFNNQVCYEDKTVALISTQSENKFDKISSNITHIDTIIKEIYSTVLKLFNSSDSSATLDIDKSLVAQGLDSLIAISLTHSLSRRYSVHISLVYLLQGISIQDIAEKIYSQMLKQSENSASSITRNEVSSLSKDASQNNDTLITSKPIKTENDDQNNTISTQENNELVWKPLNLSEGKQIVVTSLANIKNFN